MDARDGSLVGAEALLRWSGEPYGEVLPGRFVPWLEQDPCFYDLGNWIMGRALEDGVRMVRRHPGLRLNVNVSHTQIGRTGFRDAVVGALGRTGFPPENLCIELTERCRAIDRDTLMAEMAFFRARGIKVALDDFGTGAASLNLVRNLPIDLAEDRPLLRVELPGERGRPGHRRRRGELRRRLGIEVCIEGVEDAGIVEFIAGLPWRASRASTTPARSTWSTCWPSGTELPAAPRPRGRRFFRPPHAPLPGRASPPLSLRSAPVSPRSLTAAAVDV